MYPQSGLASGLGRSSVLTHSPLLSDKMYQLTEPYLVCNAVPTPLGIEFFVNGLGDKSVSKSGSS